VDDLIQDEKTDFENILSLLIKAFRDYKDRTLEKYKQITPDFNAFSTVDLLELQLSRLIGELLNPHGAHGQDSLFLDLFIKQFLQDKNIPGESSQASLELEHSLPDNSGRIDIFIDFDKSFRLAIENKPFAPDQPSQIERYYEYMDKNYGSENFLILYFSPDGSPPSNFSMPKQDKHKLDKQLKSISYVKLANWCGQCAAEAKKKKATRLSILIEEFSEYMNRTFLGRNTLKNKMLGEQLEEQLEKYVLEAYELNLLWQENQKQYETRWQNKINELINEKLPELVFKNLQTEGIIDDNWEWLRGDFDINKKSIRGFKLKKKNWKNFKLGLMSDRFKRREGKRSFFLALLSKINIERENYAADYYKSTGCNPEKDPTLKNPSTIWYGYFPDKDFQIWGYEQWKGIKEGGDTVSRVTDLFKKLIGACEADIDREEEKRQNP